MALVSAVLNKRNRLGLAGAMTGQNSAFNLPANYGFDELAGYEESRRRILGQQARDKILGQRTALASSLGQQAKSRFETMTPGLLEDLNRRGLLTSQSEVANATTSALKDIELENQNKLLDLDLAATSAELQGEQDALDAGLDLRRGSLEARLGDAAANREEALARDLAKKASRNNLYSSLIGVGGNLGSSLLTAKLLGGGTAAASGTAGAAGAAGTAGAGGAATAGAGAGGLAALAPVAGAAGGVALWDLDARNAQKMGMSKKDARMLAVVPGTATTVQAVKKVTKKIFCFDAMTPVTMADGTVKPICEIELGDKTKGGMVESVRISITPDGTLYSHYGELVTGSHAVKENGHWIRVEDSPNADPIEGEREVYSIVTSDHRIFVNGVTYADEHETEFYESLNMDESLAELNRQDEAAMVN